MSKTKDAVIAAAAVWRRARMTLEVARDEQQRRDARDLAGKVYDAAQIVTAQKQFDLACADLDRALIDWQHEEARAAQQRIAQQRADVAEQYTPAGTF